MPNSNTNSIVNQTHEDWNWDSNSIKFREPNILRDGIQIPIPLNSIEFLRTKCLQCI
ncbi:hypothetical protein Hanom_Chr10g00950091 [Helianthus anomalus]